MNYQKRLPITISLAGAATFSALAYLVGLIVPAAIQPPFPVLFYLRFDPSEIMDVSSLLLFGPIVGVVTATVHFVILTATGNGDPFGPSLKYLGVLSTYAGIILAGRLGRRKLVKTGLVTTSLGLLTRVGLMTIVNYLYFVYLAQAVFGANYAGFAQGTLAAAGINLTGTDLVTMILGITAAYNGVHAILSIVGSLVIVTALVTRGPHLFTSDSWIIRKLLLLQPSGLTRTPETKPLTV